MGKPAHLQKEHLEHAIDAIQARHMTGFPIPSATFEILKGRCDPPAQTIIGDALATRWPIGNHQQRLLFMLIPTGTQIGLNGLLLPQPNVPIKSLPRLTHQIRNATGGQETTLGRPMLTRVLGTDAKQIMPPLGLAEFHHRKAAKRALADDRTRRFSKMRSQTLK